MITHLKTRQARKKNTSTKKSVPRRGLCGIEIGNDVSIAHDVSIISFEHVYDNLNIPIKDQGLKSKKIKINDNVWVAAKAVLLAGTVINSGAIIGASAVVTKSCEKNTIYGGIPAKAIKKRGEEQ